MRGYSGMNSPLSACLHFVRNGEIDDGLDEVVATIRQAEIDILYVDYVESIELHGSVISAIAEGLMLQHRPHGEKDLVPFLDDLITQSHHRKGLVIVIGGGGNFLSEDKFGFFDLVEAFMIQFHHWFDKGKPCHLCFQMEDNPLVKDLFGC